MASGQAHLPPTGPARAITQRGLPLRKDLAYDLTGHIRQPEVAASVAEGQLLVVQTQQRQQRGVQVVGVHAALDGADHRCHRS